MANIANLTIKELKHQGMLQQKENNLFSVRLRIAGGFVPSDYLPVVEEVAKKYGKGHIHLTARQCIEIPGIEMKDLDRVKDIFESNGIQLGVTGPCVRTITACQGDTCKHGIIPAQELAQEIDKIFYGFGGLPHKFKIGITGCPNACIKPYENDLGIMGVVKKSFNREKCTLCGACSKICPVNAITITDERLLLDKRKCVDCGKCTKVCNRNAWDEVSAGYKIYVGGKMGKTPHLGHIAFLFIEGKESLFALIAKTLKFYKTFGNPKERFGDCIDRVSLASYVNYISSNIFL